MSLRLDARHMIGIAVIIALAAFSGPAATAAPAAKSVAAQAKGSTREVVFNAASFRCIRDLTPVRDFYVDNLLGDVAATVAVAKSPTGKAYPPGSLVVVNPSLAMVKHQPGRNPETNDWEFIELDVTAKGATILGRGFADLNMRSGFNCFNCHKTAKPAWDMICEQTHGCPPIPLTPAMMRGIQNTDPRCPKIKLPADEVEALATLAARGPPPQPAK
jgi:hypothetical protein